MSAAADSAPRHGALRRARPLHADPGRPRVVMTGFDVAAYTREVRTRPEAAAVTDPGVRLRVEDTADLEFLRGLYDSALAEMRTMLSSWTGHEARITAFLSTWAVERYWAAGTLHDLLREHGARQGTQGGPAAPGPRTRPLAGLARPLPGRLRTLPGRLRTLPSRLRTLPDRVRVLYDDLALPVVSTLAGLLFREPVTAGHMARMAVHEGALLVATETARDRLPASARPPVDQIIGRQRRAVEFFRNEAQARIQRSAAERVIAAVLLGPPWAPLRRAGVPLAGEARTLRRLLDDPAVRERLAASDAVIGSHLPGHPSPTLSLLARSRRRQRGGGS